MSKYEGQIAELLTARNVQFRRQQPIPIFDYPWRTKYSRGLHSDFYLPDKDLHLEVKGYMTLEAMFKMRWLIDNCNYYIFQVSEHLWVQTPGVSKAESLRKQILQQADEIVTLPVSKFRKISKERLHRFCAYSLLSG